MMSYDLPKLPYWFPNLFIFEKEKWLSGFLATTGFVELKKKTLMQKIKPWARWVFNLVLSDIFIVMYCNKHIGWNYVL